MQPRSQEFVRLEFCQLQALSTLGTRGFSRVRREFSVLAEGRHIHYKDLTETGNRTRKVSGTQGKHSQTLL